MKSLEKPPELRYQSASEMRQALYDAVGGQARLVCATAAACPMSLQERLNAAKNASSETLVMAPKKTGGTIEMAKATLDEVSDDFRSGFHTVGWSKFSLNGMPRLVVGLLLCYLVAMPALGLLGKTAVALTYTDFWMLGWLAFNTLHLDGLCTLRPSRAPLSPAGGLRAVPPLLGVLGLAIYSLGTPYNLDCTPKSSLLA